MNKPVQVTVDASKWTGKLAHTWNYIGYDECNYTHSPGGMDMLSKFGDLEKPYYVRTHHLLCTGICHGFYKWGSTNAYIEDENGNPIYNFEVIDRMCDIWLARNCKPFFEIGFMPMDLADMPEPDKTFNNAVNDYRSLGWRRPPKDYTKWYNLIHTLVTHLKDRYGEEELNSWYFEMWNEPDIDYWNGTHEEFCKLYDYTEAAIHAVIPSVRFGGPATCGSFDHQDKASVFLRKFLQHTKSGKNYYSGSSGTRLDFTTFHTKGGGYAFTTNPKLENTPSVKRMLDQIRICTDVIKECGYGDLECILSEADPDGWAAGGRFDNPAFDYRNTEYYASYVASTYKNIYDQAEDIGMDIRPLAWAFMFEGERCFEGTRTFATQGIDKAVMNTMRIFAKMGDQKISLTSSQDQDPEKYADYWGEGLEAEVDGWATITGDSSVEVMLYCHKDTWETDGSVGIEFAAENLPFEGPFKVTHYRIDKNHSNAYAEWVRQGKPDYPQGGQYDAIKDREGLELLEPVKTVPVIDGKAKLYFDMPEKSVSFIKIEKA